MGRTAANTLWNVVGQGLPLLVAVLAIPAVLSGLGTARFGLLALGWSLLGVFGVLDLGMGRATTRYVAERAGTRAAKQMAEATWTSAVVLGSAGVAAGLVLFAGASILAGRILHVPAALLPEAEASFRVLALGVPFALASNAFRGALEGLGRFDLTTLARAPISSANYLVPLLAIRSGAGLTAIFMLLVGVRVAGTVAYTTLCAQAWPAPFAPRLAPAREIGSLLGYGGWLAVSGVLVASVVYLDRLLIGMFRTMEDVAFYTAPYEVASRLLFLPAGLAAVLFPLYSALESRDDAAAIVRSTGAALRWTALVMAPICAMMIVGAPEILNAWLGADVALRSTGVLRVLTAAVFLNALGYPAVALVEGVGRPDLVAKYHLVELPLYVAITAALIMVTGIMGAALAWLLRMAITIPLFVVLSTRASGLSPRSLTQGATGRALTLSAGLMVASMALTLVPRVAATYGALAGLLVTFGLLTWRAGLTDDDRRVIGDAFASILARKEGVPRA